VTTSNVVGLHARIEPFVDQESASNAVLDDKVDIAVVVGDDPTVISKHSDDKMLPVVRQALVIDRSTTRLQQDGLGDAQIADVLIAPSPHLVIVDADRGGRIAAATVVSLGVYFLIFIVMAQVATGVAIEKSNRVSEVLLAIVPPRALLFGKVIGVGIIGVLPLLCGALPVVVKLIVGGSLPPGTGGVVGAGAAWFVLGAGLYLLMAGALGALVERRKKRLHGGQPLGLPSSSPTSSAERPTRPPGAVMAYVPLSSPMVEPARLALGVSSPAEVVISLTSVSLRWSSPAVASTIYRRAI
jgi:ABC-2 type transport system permease protein